MTDHSKDTPRTATTRTTSTPHSPSSANTWESSSSSTCHPRARKHAHTYWHKPFPHTGIVKPKQY
uniref:Uncharacterized protein n=1 Tax=Anopheles atroparvus TaxID=41427 RepID=A0AAG5CR03_ANOAO